MVMLYVLLFFFIAVAAFYCIDKHFQKRRLFIKNPKLKINYSFHEWKIVDYSALLIVSCVGVLFVLVFLKLMGGAIPYIVPRIIFLIICVTTIIFSISYYSLASFYAKHSGVIKISATLATLVVTLISNSMADATIASYTNIDAAKFPVAQKMFILIGVIGIWIYVAMYAIFPVFILALVKVIKGQFSWARKKRAVKYWELCTNFNADKQRDINLGVAAFVGLTYTILILLGVITSIDSKGVDRTLKKVLVFASFHLPPSVCGIETYYYGSLISFVGENEVVLAMPDREMGYTFHYKKCDIQPVKIERKQVAPIHRLIHTENSFPSFRAISQKVCPVQYCSAIHGGSCI